MCDFGLSCEDNGDVNLLRTISILNIIVSVKLEKSSRWVSSVSNQKMCLKNIKGTSENRVSDKMSFSDHGLVLFSLNLVIKISLAETPEGSIGFRFEMITFVT